MIIPGIEVISKVRILDFEADFDIAPGTKGLVIDIVTDAVTNMPMFVIRFHGQSDLCGAFLPEIEAVEHTIKGEWV